MEVGGRTEEGRRNGREKRASKRRRKGFGMGGVLRAHDYFIITIATVTFAITIPVNLTIVIIIIL